jgi:hypothetical protein
VLDFMLAGFGAASASGAAPIFGMGYVRLLVQEGVRDGKSEGRSLVRASPLIPADSTAIGITIIRRTEKPNRGGQPWENWGYIAFITVRYGCGGNAVSNYYYY